MSINYHIKDRVSCVIMTKVLEVHYVKINYLNSLLCGLCVALTFTFVLSYRIDITQISRQSSLLYVVFTLNPNNLWHGAPINA